MKRLYLYFVSLFLIGIYAKSQGQQLGFDVVVEKNVMIASEDGTLLATDIYRPAINGVAKNEQLPLLLQRTPYNKEANRFVPQAIYFASNDYIVALQDLRGQFNSTGTFIKYNPLEAIDGKYTVEYLARLPYVNGKVGMWGTSYGAHTQADASKLKPKGLQAMILNMGGMANAWDHAVRQGGAFELGREITWAFRQIPKEIKDSVVQAQFAKETIEDWYQAMPLRKGLNPLSIAPNFETYFLEELTHGDYDKYWEGIGINWQAYYEQTADVPMIHFGGWYDIFLRGTIQNYVELDLLQETPKWLVIGPWTHGGNHKTFAGDVSFGPAAAIDGFYNEYHMKWFDFLLKEAKDPEFTTQPVQLFIMGDGDGTKDADGRLRHGGYWIESDQWPLSNTQSLTYYLHEDGMLSSAMPSSDSSSTTFTFDPDHPVPTLGGNVSARVKDGGFDQRERPDFVGSKSPFLPLKSRADVVVFQTEPLERAVTIAGPIKLKLYVSSTAVDTDFTIKLLDVYPPSKDFPSGFDLNLTDGVVRMSYRNNRTTRDLITPNQVYEIEINPFPTANIFKKGHRIRLDISSSNWPRWDVNPNTGELLGKHRRKIKADNTIFHDSLRASHIVLSLIDYEANQNKE